MFGFSHYRFGLVDTKYNIDPFDLIGIYKIESNREHEIFILEFDRKKITKDANAIEVVFFG